MRRRSLPLTRPGHLLLATSLALAGAAVAAEAADGGPAGYLSRTLPNGLRVSILADRAMPVVATQVWYHVGSANEEPHLRGLAHLFEHLMFGGTAAHPKQAVWDHHERFGGKVNAFTSFDETVYHSEIPPAGFPAVLELEADRMVNLALTVENLANEKRIVTEELRVSTENEPTYRLFTAALKGLFGDHPYALIPVGTREDIAAATLEHAREFYTRYYRPRNAHLVVVGPVDPEAVLKRVEELFGPLPADGVTPADVPALDTRTYPRLLELVEDLPPVELVVAPFPLPPPSHPDHDALLVLGRLLAGGSVVPFEEDLVRRRHRAIYGHAEVRWMRRGGVLLMLAGNLPYRRQATALQDVDQTLQDLSRLEWLDERSLDAAKRALVQEEQARAYSAGEMASAIGGAAWDEGDESRAFDGAQRMGRVSRAQVEAAFRTYVLQARPIRLYARPQRVPLLVRLFGWLYPLVGGG